MLPTVLSRTVQDTMQFLLAACHAAGIESRNSYFGRRLIATLEARPNFQCCVANETLLVGTSILPGCLSTWTTSPQLPVATPARPRRREISWAWMGSWKPLSRRVLVHCEGRVDACGLTCGAPVVDSAVRTGRRQGPGCTAHEAAASALQQVTGTTGTTCGCLRRVRWMHSVRPAGVGCCPPRPPCRPCPFPQQDPKILARQLEAAIDGMALG